MIANLNTILRTVVHRISMINLGLLISVEYIFAIQYTEQSSISMGVYFNNLNGIAFATKHKY
jgi:hypothetical protein